MHPSSMVSNRRPASPAIPRFKQSQHMRRGSALRSREKVSGGISHRQAGCEKNEVKRKVGSHTKMWEQKQNMSPIIFQQKNFEMLQKHKPVSNKRPVTACQLLSHERPRQFLAALPFENRTLVEVSDFKLDDFLIDSYCSKMTHSIIIEEQSPEAISDSKPILEIPTLKASSFHKVRKLGSGKFGEVFLAMHKKTGFICAMKVIDKKMIREQKMEKQIAKEIKIHENLRSLNIIEFYGFFDDSEKFYILLEYATEGSVFNKLKGRTRMEEPEIVPIAKGICEGLNFIHKMGYIHRDIKPENIVLQFGIPKICDFGWATYCSGNTCKSYCGTPLYISPEMVRKEAYGNSVDLWAMGLIVYQLLVGMVPFRIYSESDMKEIVEKEIEFPEYIDRSYQCQNFIRGCLQKYSCLRMSMATAQEHKFIKTKPLSSSSSLEYEFYEQAKKCLASSSVQPIKQ